MRIPLVLLLPLISNLPTLTAAQPSAKVDQALRGRVTEFFTEQINKQYRQAEAIVADESKDYYYGSKKQDLKEFSIAKIEYSVDFKTAIVSVQKKTSVFFMGGGILDMNSLDRTNWKLEKGKWCWYVDQNTVMNTPFGHSKSLVAGGSAGAVPPPPLGPFQNPSAAALQGTALETQPRQVQFDAASPQAAIVNLKNTLPGPIRIAVANPSAGLTVTIAKPELAVGESTTVSIIPVAGSADHPPSVLLKVLPVSQTIPISVIWVAAK